MTGPTPRRLNDGTARRAATAGQRGVSFGSTHSAIPWQGRFLRGLSAPGVTTAALSVSRSNGKSWLAAKLARDYLLGDGLDSEAVIVASSYTQAKIIYRYVLRMVREAGNDPGDRTVWHYRDSANVALLRHRGTGQAVRALGCDPKRAHGRVFGLALMDEPAQWPRGSRDAMLSAIDTGAGKIEGSRIVALGTRPVGDHWFTDWLDGGADFVQLHAARRSDPIYWLRTIRRANPSFDHLPALRADVLRQREAARKDDAAKARYMALALNMGTPDTVEDVLVSPEAWARCERDSLPDAVGPYVLGFDLGGFGAFTAAAAFWPRTGRLEAVAACGGVPDLRERGRADSVGSLYVDLARRGELLVQPARRVPDYGVFVADVLARWGVPAVIVCDRYKVAEFRDALDAGRMPPGRPLVVRGQGYRDGAEDVRRFLRAVLERRVAPLRSLLIRSALAEARTVTDVSGNSKLAKGSEGKRRQRARDDAAAALILAVAEGDRRGIPADRPALRLVAV